MSTETVIITLLFKTIAIFTLNYTPSITLCILNFSFLSKITVELTIGCKVCNGSFWLYRARLPPVVLDPNILNKGVETGPAATQFGLACAQTMPYSPRVCLRQAELF